MAISLNLLGRKNGQVTNKTTLTNSNKATLTNSDKATLITYLNLFKSELDKSRRLEKLLVGLINNKKYSEESLKRDIRITEIIITLIHKYFDKLERKKLIDKFLLSQAERIIVNDFSRVKEIKISKGSITKKYEELHSVVLDLTSAIETTIDYISKDLLKR